MFGQLARLCQRKGGEDYLCVLCTHPTVRDAYQKKAREAHKLWDGPPGKKLTTEWKPGVILAEVEYLIEDTASCEAKVNYQVILTDSPEQGLPRGLLVQTSIFPVSSGVHRVKVKMKNESTCDIPIPLNRTVTHMYMRLWLPSLESYGLDT
ncbi:unnamed protein product [Caretta caretta]